MINIITLNYNQNDYTIKCVESLLKTNYQEFQIILVDNGSSEENYNILLSELPEDNRLKLHRLVNNRGYVGGINFGLEESKNSNVSYILILNNDTLLDPEAVGELVKTCDDYNQKAIVTGKVYHYDDPNRLQDIGYSYRSKKALQFNRIGLNEIDDGQFDEICERDMLDDVFWLFSRKLLDQIGGYSPYFWFNAEQADFALRAKKEGYKLIFTPKAKLWHKGSISIGGRDRNPILAYWHIQSTLIFRYLHLSKFQFLLQYFRVVREIFTGYLKAIINKLKGQEYDFNYPLAKLQGFRYFNKWFFIRNVNTGIEPFKKVN